METGLYKTEYKKINFRREPTCCGTPADQQKLLYPGDIINGPPMPELSKKVSKTHHHPNLFLPALNRGFCPLDEDQVFCWKDYFW
ncbi:hypothetical protein CEXT_58511 [Caerostris extrusa]|uniref:Uncharacterized protein n=1 Tax=Caerostris extrusa TaxID=172846 RepID=A0AAV4U063_CAEEX|nr:hypothetical protein CEXT_58511 [Caerostris extrusa]